MCEHRICKEEIDVIGFHGQTIYHSPQDKVTQQIGDPNLLTTLLKTNVVGDFRRRDIANGGQGAPLVPIFHKVLAKHILRSNNPKNSSTKDLEIQQNSTPIVILNIGGVANITYIDGEEIIASDVGLGSAMIDDMVSKAFGIRYDDRGAISAKGSVIYTAALTIMDDPFFTKPLPKSMDRNHFQNLVNDTLKNVNPVNAMATLSECVVLGIKKAIFSLPKRPQKVIVCGGGRLNSYIIKRLNDSLNSSSTMSQAQDYISVLIIEDACPQVQKSSTFDLFNGDLIEAYAFGYIAVRSLLSLPITFPSTTGTRFPVSGGTICLAEPAKPSLQ